MPRREGKDPGWLSGKINERKWVQPVFLLFGWFWGLYSSVLKYSGG